jgi:hypothetical protein
VTGECLARRSGRVRSATSHKMNPSSLEARVCPSSHPGRTPLKDGGRRPRPAAWMVRRLALVEREVSAGGCCTPWSRSASSYPCRALRQGYRGGDEGIGAEPLRRAHSARSSGRTWPRGAGSRGTGPSRATGCCIASWHLTRPWPGRPGPPAHRRLTAIRPRGERRVAVVST